MVTHKRYLILSAISLFAVDTIVAASASETPGSLTTSSVAVSVLNPTYSWAPMSLRDVDAAGTKPPAATQPKLTEKVESKGMIMGWGAVEYPTAKVFGQELRVLASSLGLPFGDFSTVSNIQATSDLLLALMAYQGNLPPALVSAFAGLESADAGVVALSRFVVEDAFKDNGKKDTTQLLTAYRYDATSQELVTTQDGVTALLRELAAAWAKKWTAESDAVAGSKSTLFGGTTPWDQTSALYRATASVYKHVQRGMVTYDMLAQARTKILAQPEAVTQAALAIATAQAAATAADAKSTALHEQIAAVTAEAGTLRDQLAALRTELSVAQGIGAGFTDALQKGQLALTAKTAEYDVAQGKLTAVTAARDALESQLGAATAEGETLRTQLAAASAAHAVALDAAAADLAAARGQIAAHEATIAETKRALDVASKDAAAVVAENVTNRGALMVQAAQMKTLQEELARATAALTSISSGATAGDSVKDLKAQMAVMQQEFASMQGTLQRQLAQVATERDGYVSEVVALQDRVSALTRDLSGARQALSGLRSGSGAVAAAGSGSASSSLPAKR